MTEPQEDLTVTRNSLPALYGHCQEVFATMLEQAEMDGEQMKYVGFLTKLIITELNLATPQYSATTNKLQAMGCIEQIRRGGGGSPSEWALHMPPTEDLFLRTADVPRSKRSSRKDQEAQHLRDLAKRIGDLEDQVALLKMRLDNA
jgi:hypothetical protein